MIGQTDRQTNKDYNFIYIDTEILNLPSFLLDRNDFKCRLQCSVEVNVQLYSVIISKTLFL